MNKEITTIKKSLNKDLQKLFGFSEKCLIKWKEFSFYGSPSQICIDFEHPDYEDLVLTIFVELSIENNNGTETFFTDTVGILKQFNAFDITESYSQKSIIEKAEHTMDSFIKDNLKEPIDEVFSRQNDYDIDDEDGMYASFNIHRRFKIRNEENSMFEKQLDKIMYKHVFWLHDIQINDEITELLLEEVYIEDLFTNVLLDNHMVYWNNVLDKPFIKDNILQILKNNNDIESINNLLKINYKT